MSTKIMQKVSVEPHGKGGSLKQTRETSNYDVGRGKGHEWQTNCSPRT
jgi:hypothetical protein